eukprot:scaffold5419_cov186-Ochromonas_danica.AAC.3
MLGNCTGLWPTNRDVHLRSASVLREFEAIPEAVLGKMGQAFGHFQSRNVSLVPGEERESFESDPTNMKKRKRKKPKQLPKFNFTKLILKRNPRAKHKYCSIIVLRGALCLTDKQTQNN